jgi:hypothetical protein
MNVKQLNENTILVKPEFHIISGRKKLRLEDLNLPDGVHLPPETVASLGSKKFIDPDEIAKFNRLRDQAHKACEKVGVKFLGGYAVPTKRLDELADELDEKVSDFDDVRTQFLSNYGTIIDNWCASNPEWEDILRRSVTPESSVASSLSADYFLYQAGIPEGISSDRLDKQAEGLGEQMFTEITKDAEKFISESLSIKGNGQSSIFRDDKVGVTQKALRPIRRMRDKMEGLSFLDSSIRPVIDHIDTVLKRMPDKGRIQGEYFNQMFMLAIAMSDKNNIKLLGTAMGSAIDDNFDFAESDAPTLVFDDEIEPLDNDIPTVDLPDEPVIEHNASLLGAAQNVDLSNQDDFF